METERQRIKFGVNEKVVARLEEEERSSSVMASSYCTLQ